MGLPAAQKEKECSYEDSLTERETLHWFTSSLHSVMYTNRYVVTGFAKLCS